MYKNLDEALAARKDLVSRIQSIDVQLSHRAAEVSVGRVPDEQYKEYRTWRASACHAKQKLVEQLREAKAWITNYHQDRWNAVDLLEDLYGVTKELVSAGAEIRPEEEEVLRDVDLFLSKTRKESTL